MATLRRCTVQRCGSPVKEEGLCAGHLWRQRLKGDPMPEVPLPKVAEGRQRMDDLDLEIFCPLCETYQPGTAFAPGGIACAQCLRDAKWLATPTSVYLFYNDEDELLYVGITMRHRRRLGEHAATKDWWQEVSYAEFEHYSNWHAAAEREVELIKTAGPKYNIVHAA